MSQNKHIGTITLFGDDYRFVIDTHSRAGCYSPELHIYRKGANDSASGVGPKGFPAILGMFRPKRDKGKTYKPWLGMLAITLPHVSWAKGYKLRKVGGLKLYAAIYNQYRKVVA